MELEPRRRDWSQKPGAVPGLGSGWGDRLGCGNVASGKVAELDSDLRHPEDPQQPLPEASLQWTMALILA